MVDAWTREIERLTLGVLCLRTVHELIYKRDIDMAARLIEIKGLGDAVANAKKGIADLKVSAGKLNMSTGKLVAEINDLNEQVEQHRSDLRFEAGALGNGDGSDEQSETERKEVDKLLASKEVTGSQNSSGSFQNGATDNSGTTVG